MILFLLGILVGCSMLVVCDWLCAKKRLSPELARKIPHLSSGSIVATWPVYVSYKTIIVAMVVYLALTVFVHKRGLFERTRNVGRKSWGEWGYPVAVIALALLKPSPWIFAVALLHFALADALAAIVGIKYGTKPTTYKIFGHTKTLIGTVTFCVTSLILVGLLLIFDSSFTGPTLATLFLVPVMSTILENVGLFGLDNLLVPLGVGAILLLLN